MRKQMLVFVTLAVRVSELVWLASRSIPSAQLCCECGITWQQFRVISRDLVVNHTQCVHICVCCGVAVVCVSPWNAYPEHISLVLCVMRTDKTRAGGFRVGVRVRVRVRVRIRVRGHASPGETHTAAKTSCKYFHTRGNWWGTAH